MLNTHNKFIDFGKHKGERWTRLPISYLKWIVNEGKGHRKEMARSELERRGTSMVSQEIELSGHAIDRASQITDEWKEKGLHSWLMEIATEASRLILDSDTVEYKGYKFAFILGEFYPTLKTIIKKD